MKTITNLVNDYLKDNKPYNIDNEKVCFLLRNNPIIYQIAGYLLNKNISLIMCKTKEDYFWYTITAIYVNSIIEDKNGQFKRFVEPENFLNKVQEFIFNYTDVPYIFNIYITSMKKTRKLKILAEYKNNLKFLLDIYNKTSINNINNIFSLFDLKNFKKQKYNMEEIRKMNMFASVIKNFNK